MEKPSEVTSEQSNREMAEGIALANGFELFQHYSERQSAKFLKTSLTTLQRVRISGKIAYLQISDRRFRYFGQHLAEYLINQTICPKPQNTVSNSENIGSPIKVEAPTGVVPGMTVEQDKRDAAASALRILNKPASS